MEERGAEHPCEQGSVCCWRGDVGAGEEAAAAALGGAPRRAGAPSRPLGSSRGCWRCSCTHLEGVHVPSPGKLRQHEGQPPRDTPCRCSGVTLASFLPAPAHHERLQRSPHHRPWRLRGGVRLPESGHGQNVTGGRGWPWSHRGGGCGGVAMIGVRGCSSVTMAAALLETRGRHGGRGRELGAVTWLRVLAAQGRGVGDEAPRAAAGDPAGTLCPPGTP